MGNITDKAVSDMHLTVSMEIQFRQIISYLTASGADADTVIMRLYEEGFLPASGKEAGKAALRKFRAAALAEADNARKSAAALSASENESDSLTEGSLSVRKITRVYAEKAALHYPETAVIIKRLGSLGEDIKYIDSYKDVFYRYRGEADDGRNLVLAVRREKLIMQGSGFCQDFGNRYFYYASCVMNCIYDCEYCYLKGMYPSDDIVIYVNTEDYFNKLRELLKEHPVYLCISYDTDLAALDGLTGFISRWNIFAEENPELTLEIRTKSSSRRIWGNKPLGNVIYAFTLSPESVCKGSEKGAPGLSERMSCIKDGIEKGFRLRVCLDPLIAVPGWEEEYAGVIDLLGTEPYRSGIYDLSCGSFRISSSYLKNIRKKYPLSPVCQYPYELKEGAYSYGEELSRRMCAYLKERLKLYFSEDRIYVWDN